MTTYHVAIRRNADGEVRTFDDVDTFDDPGTYLYLWQEGNWECNCNRGEFFNNRKVQCINWDVLCGSGAFSVNITLPTGASFFKEFE